MSYVTAFFGPLTDLWSQEPVLVTTAVTAAIDLFIAFGWQVDQNQRNAIIVFVTALGAIIARGRVSPAPTVTGIRITTTSTQ